MLAWGRAHERRGAAGFPALVLLVLLIAAVPAAEAETSLLIGGSFGLESYAGREYVIKAADGSLLSRLDWNAPRLPVAGVRTELYSGRFSASFDFSFLPTDYAGGSMQDYDWLCVDQLHPSYPVTTLTEFSTHKLRVLQNDRYRFQAAWRLFGGSAWSLSPLAGFQWASMDLQSFGGYLQHSEDDENPTPWTADRPKQLISESTKVIEYMTDVQSLWLGLMVSWNPVRQFGVIVEGSVSPYQKIEMKDFHYKTNTSGTLRRDCPTDGLIWNGAVNLRLETGKVGCFNLGVNISDMTTAKGNTYALASNGSGGYAWNLDSKYLGGHSYFSWEVSLSYLIRIF